MASGSAAGGAGGTGAQGILIVTGMTGIPKFSGMFERNWEGGFV